MQQPDNISNVFNAFYPQEALKVAGFGSCLIEILELGAKFEITMVSCSRFNSSDHEMLRSLEFVIQINLEHDTFAIWNVARSWSIST